MLNHPIHAFGDTKHTMGFFLYNDKLDTNDLEYNHARQYVKALFHTMLKAQDIEFEKDPSIKAISVQIDNLGISGFDFDVSNEQEEGLYQSELKATQDYITKEMSAVWYPW